MITQTLNAFFSDIEFFTNFRCGGADILRTVYPIYFKFSGIDNLMVNSATKQNIWRRYYKKKVIAIYILLLNAKNGVFGSGMKIGPRNKCKIFFYNPCLVTLLYNIQWNLQSFIFWYVLLLEIFAPPHFLYFHIRHFEMVAKATGWTILRKKIFNFLSYVMYILFA